MEEQINHIKTEIDSHVLTQRDDFKEIKEMIGGLQSNFAGKWVEKVAIGSLVTLLGGVALLLVAVI